MVEHFENGRHIDDLTVWRRSMAEFYQDPITPREFVVFRLKQLVAIKRGDRVLISDSSMGFDAAQAVVFDIDVREHPRGVYVTTVLAQ